MRHLPYPLLGLLLALSSTGAALAGEQYYPLDKGSAPYAVAPSAQGAVWYGTDGGHSLGRLDPTSGESVQVPLGEGARPRAIVSDESGNAWVLDSGLNAILRIGGERLGSERFPLPAKAAPAGLESAVFDDDGRLWFTGSRGFHGRLDPARRLVEVWPSPQGKAANGICVTPDGEVWYAQDDALVHVDPLDGSAERLPAPEGTKALRGIGADSIGRLWASDSGGARLYRYDPSDASWQSWPLPDSQARPDSLRVDAMDRVWLHDA
ncbi:Vgb family protein, partial [Pseudomonas aeruginosa]